MKRLLAMMLSLVMLCSVSVNAFASGEASTEMTADEQAWWDSYTIPEGMEDVTLYPDDQTELRAKNYETVCRYMQGLSPYLYLLYADDVVTGVAYDFSLTSDAMRITDMDTQKALDAYNAASYPDWQWTNIKVYQTEDPNMFLVECDGSGTYTSNGQAIFTHTDHYMHRFTLEDGKITEYIQFNNPIQLMIELGYEVPFPSGDSDSDDTSSDSASSEADATATTTDATATDEAAVTASSDTSTASTSSTTTGMTAEEQAWWDSFTMSDELASVTLFPDDQTELRAKNYETACRYIDGLSPYLYLLYADEFTTGVAYDFGGTSNPYNPVMFSDLEAQKAMDAANATEEYSDWAEYNLVVWQSDDPNILLIESDGSGNGHSDHFLNKFTFKDGKIAQYVEFNSPLNELIEGGYEVPTLFQK